MKILRFLLSPVFMGILFIVFAASMAAATFIENDYGSPAAYNFVYDTRWFELILLLLAVNLAGQVITYRLYRPQKLTIMIFHLSFLLIAAGAAITRYTGWEGSVHIREGETQDECYSGDRYLGFIVKDESGKMLNEHSRKYYMSSSSAGSFRKKISIDGRNYEIALSRIYPNAAETLSEAPGGSPLMSLTVTDSLKREAITLKNTETANFDELNISLNSGADADVAFFTDSSGFFVRSKFPLTISGMMTREIVRVDSGNIAEVKPMQIISVKDIRIVAQEMQISGIIRIVSVDRNMHETGKNAFVFNIIPESGPAVPVTLWDDETRYRVTGEAEVDGNNFEIHFGSNMIKLPFSLRLTDFILERYPGSNSPSGYKSEVLLIDSAMNIEEPYTIYMNNILKHRGYRFYQSSYDMDEKGTVLSINHDPAGMLVTYTGYGLLVLFIILSLLNRKSVFNTVNAGFWYSAMRKKVVPLLLFLTFSGLGTIDAQKLIPDRKAADAFGNILVQDQKGRTKPLFTLSNDILRKVARENKFDRLTPMQVYLGVFLDFDNWKSVPLLRVSNRDLQMRLGISGSYAAFEDIVDLGTGSYKLQEDVSKAYSKAPGERTRIDKETMKVDERINILYMVYTGEFLRMFPLHGDPHNWGTPEEAIKTAMNSQDSLYINSVIPMFAEALKGRNNGTALQIAGSIADYQKKFSRYELPSASRIKAESLYYRMMIFERLFPFYSSIGIVMLAGLIVMVMQGRKKISLFVKILGIHLIAGFLFHTFGLALRWYIAGHSPMSNGYESMIFISWVTILAGIFFSRRSPFALSATAVLSGLTLMVAHLSFMDPEITSLVPVLKSYWLTLHVSVITGSYGFLGLGAILGIIIMILISLSGERNLERISATVDELTVINYKSLTLGLYLLTIGTFLGAVWANESWGRYWGWDPKETWSLITIIVYSFVIHSRNIPGMKDIYTFNLMSLFAVSSVLMTYFGVNYYLTGLHSYAGGDPVPVPAFVYIALLLLVSLSVAANIKYRRWEKG